VGDADLVKCSTQMILERDAWDQVLIFLCLSHGYSNSYNIRYRFLLVQEAGHM